MKLRNAISPQKQNPLKSSQCIVSFGLNCILQPHNDNIYQSTVVTLWHNWKLYLNSKNYKLREYVTGPTKTFQSEALQIPLANFRLNFNN